MAKKSGLHKNVSSIFDGITLPQEQDGSATPTPFKAGAGASSEAGSGFMNIGPRQKKMMVIVGLLAAVLGFIVLNSLGVFSSTPSRAAAAENHATVTESTSPAPEPPVAAAQTDRNDPFILMNWERPAVFESFSRDPMQPIMAKTIPGSQTPATGSSESAATAPAIKVAGIVYSETRPAAIIGQEVMHEGEEVQGVKIVKIHRDRVVLEQNGKTWEQTLEAK